MNEETTAKSKCIRIFLWTQNKTTATHAVINFEGTRHVTHAFSVPIGMSNYNYFVAKPD